jgi:hypothetical protein
MQLLFNICFESVRDVFFFQNRSIALALCNSRCTQSYQPVDMIRTYLRSDEPLALEDFQDVG